MTAPKCRTCGHNHYGTCLQCPECIKTVKVTDADKSEDVKLTKPVKLTREVNVKVNKEDVKLTEDTGSCATCKYKLYYEKNNSYMKDYMKKKRQKGIAC